MSLTVGSPNMGAWETDEERNPPSFPTLQKPLEGKASGVNSRTPSRSSRRSRRSATPPGRISKSPPPMPGSDKTDKSDRIPRDHATDEKISILDPRRFTPTLHANLVGEILSLKRDQEEKRRVIEGLESQLQTIRDEEDDIHSSLQVTAKENRSLKRQLALLEGGTSSALAELARERDEAVEGGAESKRRLETALKKLKLQEDTADSVNGAWTNDKNEWEEERRRSDRKIHILETRLKTVLAEVEAYQASLNSQSSEPLVQEDSEDKARDFSDTASVRSMSQSRFSILQKPNGHTLAEELDFDDESDYGTETNGRDSVMSNYTPMRSDSRASARAKFHRRHNSGESLIRPGSVVRGRFQHLHKESILSNGIIQEADEPPSPAAPAVCYVDTGVQYSPPPSPVLKASKPSTPEPKSVTALAAKWEKQNYDEMSTEANSRRKRISIAKPLSIQAPSPAKLMVSTAAQTAEIPLSPPGTPKFPLQEQPIVPETKQLPMMVAIGTQTEDPASSRPARPEAGLIRIPSIAIHPPKSQPTTPKKSLLPQLQRDIGCQVSLPAAPMVTSGMQTEEIRIDQRLDKLPAHLRPSAVTSRPVSPAELSQQKPAHRGGAFTLVPGNIPARNPKRLASQSTIVAASPRESLELDNTERTMSPTNSSRKTSARISSNAFTAFHDISSADEMDDFGDGDQSDNEFRTALSAPRAVRSPEPGRSPRPSTPSSPETVVQSKVKDAPYKTPASPLGNTNIYNAYKLSGNQGVAMPDRNSSMKSGLRPSAMSSSSKGSMRKAALIQTGINAHQDDAADPPFPIPTRASSRQPMFSAGMRTGAAADNRSPTRHDSGHRRGTRTGMYRANSLRKSRSAAAVQGAKHRHNKKSSVSPSPDVPSTPVPPMPSNASSLATPRNERPRGRGHRHQNSGTTATTEATTGFQSNASSQTANGVVDAIAQTMVGEWMFKYVRRRKSFGLGGDNNGRDDSSNDRHKRWVWLAPYERAILWSSKQPSSGSALLGGKSGRKLVIQSVLDVKDDNSPPKGQFAVFNRSILILTPQRALKFTATNADRHYLWLTALSFLAHSQQDIPDIPTPITTITTITGGSNKNSNVHRHQIPDFIPPPPPPTTLQSGGGRARPRIRDSIRLAKSQHPSMLSPPNGGGIGGAMSSQSQQQHHQHLERTMSPTMPSIPDVPAYATTNNNNNRPETSDSSAEPPVISRFGRNDAPMMPAFHGRKRSNTGGRVPPPLSFRGFPAAAAGVGGGYGHAVVDSQSTAGSDFHFGGGGQRSAVEPTWSELDRSDSRASMAPSTAGSNMFEAIGTMRMEAFISPLAFSRFEAEGGGMNYPESGGARKRNKEMRRRRSRSRSRSRTREDGAKGVVRGGVAGWREEYMSTYAGGHGRRESRYGGGGREIGYRTAGEEEVGRGRRRRDRNPFEGF